jgi:hypothetical protein
LKIEGCMAPRSDKTPIVSVGISKDQALQQRHHAVAMVRAATDVPHRRS